MEIKNWKEMYSKPKEVSEKELIKLSVRYPEAKLLAHPECDENILKHADHIGSTTSIINFAKDSEKTQFIIA